MVSFFVAKDGGAQRFIIHARASNRQFIHPPSGPFLKGEELSHVEFHGTPEDARNVCVGSADPRWLQAYLHCLLSSHRMFATGKTLDQKRLVLDPLKNLVPSTLPRGFSRAMFFCQDVTDHCTHTGSFDSPLRLRNHSTPLLLGNVVNLEQIIDEDVQTLTDAW